MKTHPSGLAVAVTAALCFALPRASPAAPKICDGCHGEGTEVAQLPGPDGPGTILAAEGNGEGTQACSGCHGAAGGGDPVIGSARLAGLDAAYLARQLRGFRLGTRSDPTMGRMAKALGEEEAEHAATYYAALRTPSAAKAGAGDEVTARGARLAAWGRWEDDVPACDRCHGPGGRGVPPHFPALAAQQPPYAEAQLTAWKTGARTNDPDGLMAAVARRLTPDDARAVAAHYGSLPPAHAQTGTDTPEPPALGGGPHPERPAGAGDGFRPPARGEAPDGPLGEAIRRGAAVFRDTPRMAGRFVGNGLACANCHLDDGRRAGSAPLWAAWVAYPAYRGKNNEVNTIEDRLRGCFRYSQNAPASPVGAPPPPSDPVLADLQAYMYWLATGAPTGAELPGRGYPELTRSEAGYDPARGEVVFRDRCALCHGAGGAGTRSGDRRHAFPPLWGPDSFNWGAGMHRVPTAAAFIRANMPLSQPGALTEQEAWDVAAFVNRHQRPPDPRQKAGMEEADRAYHDHPCYYGTEENGHRLGGGSVATDHD
ncbi:MAG: c-type cytochrome [Deferrisomatales bacterium]